jgi:ABC-type uncharacterized transport system fused permease/ATPase subunit
MAFSVVSKIDNVVASLDQTFVELLRAVGLGDLLAYLGANALDCVRNWSDVLSLGEQQRLWFVHAIAAM